MKEGGKEGGREGGRVDICSGLVHRSLCVATRKQVWYFQAISWLCGSASTFREWAGQSKCWFAINHMASRHPLKCQPAKEWDLCIQIT